MIDERHEELAALYAFDLLEGAERDRFEAALTRDLELQQRVRDLRGASCSLAHLATQPAPAALRSRILSAVVAPLGERAPVTAPPSTMRIGRFAPWALAASLAVAAAWSGQRYLHLRSEAALLRDQSALADVALQTLQQQLEAERIVSRRQFEDLEQRLARSTEELTTVRGQLASASSQLSERDRELGDARAQFVTFRDQLAQRERQVIELGERMNGLTGRSAEMDRKLGDAQRQIAQLTNSARADLAHFKITPLASMTKDSPQALAVAVWDPARQEGMLKVRKLPALPGHQDYQIWVMDPQYPDPVDGGVFTVDPRTGEANVRFKARRPVQAVNAIAVTCERKGGVTKAEGPFVLLGRE